MVTATYVLAVFLFTLTFSLTGLAQSFGQVVAITRQAFAVICDRQIDDLTKECQTQKAVWNLLKQAVLISIKACITVAMAVLPFWLADMFSIIAWHESMDFAMRWDVLIITTIVMIGAWIMWHRLVKKNRLHHAQTAGSAYHWLDRSIHHLAFGNIALQKIMDGLENKLYARQWTGANDRQPIFITSLPRAGTTVLLQAISQLPGVATHTYRDMPFILTPILWAKFSKHFYRKSVAQQRTHGDGMVIDQDSPEAFEEVVWKKFYREKYCKQSIPLWCAQDSTVEFESYFRQHIKKIVTLRQPQFHEHARYVSKNNANVAHLEVLKKIFPDARIVVPVRHPVAQAISLWRQHLNFTQQHNADNFIYQYMEDIGHYEFGKLHRPIEFPDFAFLAGNKNPNSIDYWLAYWIACFQYLMKQPGIDFIMYESICHSGKNGLARLCEHLDLPLNEESLNQAAKRFHAAPKMPHVDQPISTEFSRQAEDLHRVLAERCVLAASRMTSPAL